MRSLLPVTLSISTLLICLANTGCAGRAAARDSARRLAGSVQLYEDHLDTFLKRQAIRSASRQKELQDSRKVVREGRLRDRRIALASQAAEKMIANPQVEARPSRLTAFLQDVYDNATSLDAELLASEQQEIKQLQERMTALQSKKELAQKIRLNLTKLAANSSVADEALEAKEYATAVQKELDKLANENTNAVKPDAAKKGKGN